MSTPRTIAITGANGQLGRLVLAELRKIAPDASLIGVVRDPAKAADLAADGVELRTADYEDPASLTAALAGLDALLLISSNAIGRRLPQHRNVIDAANAAGVGFMAYTSLLRADTSPMALAEEHRQTEALLRASGLPVALLRNGWYTENYSGGSAKAVEHGVLIGAAGQGRIASAARADYAAAAARVLSGETAQHAGKVYELAGDSAYTLTELAAEISRQAGVPVAYRNLSEAEYAATLAGLGLPKAFADILADSDAKAATGALFDDGGVLHGLIGRATTPLSESVAEALSGH